MWEPKSGWNAAYSEQERVRGAGWALRLMPLHSEAATQTLVEMMLAKDKWGVMYSEEQEKVIAKWRRWVLRA